MKKSALFGIAALGMAAVGVPHAFATIEVTLNGHVIGLSSPNSFMSSSSYAGFSWTGLNVTVSPLSAGGYQLSFAVAGLTSSNTGSSVANFVAYDNAITLPTQMGINQIQGDVTANVTNGNSAESVVSSGQLNPSSANGGSTLPLTLNFANNNLSAGYSATGTSVSTNAADNMNTIELLTSDSVTLSPNTSVNTVNSVINATTTAVTTPEPATLALFAVGGLALLAGARRRKNQV
jgi:hypothetical protein